MRRVFAVFGRCLLGLLVIVVVWVICNLWDDKPAPLPQELQRDRVTLAPAGNGYFGLIGLWSARPDFIQGGVAHWSEVQDWLVRNPPAARRMDEEPPKQERELQDPRVTPHGFPGCDRHACFARWDGKPDAVISAVSTRHAALLQRCERLSGMPFEEDPTPPDFVTPMLGVDGLNECFRLWHAQSLIDWRRGKPQVAIDRLLSSRRLAERVMQGGRTLVIQLVAARHLKTTFEWTAHMVSERPEWASRAAGVAAPLSPAALDIRRALRYEVAMSREAAVGVRNGCYSGGVGKEDRQAHMFVRHVFCDGLIPLAFHPEQLRNEDLPRWQRAFEAFARPVPEGLDHLRALPEDGQLKWWQRLAWRNTGSHLLELRLSLRTYDKYLARLYDTELQRLALAAALEATGSKRLLSEILAEANRSPYAGGRLWWDSKQQAIAMTLWEGADNTMEARVPVDR